MRKKFHIKYLTHLELQKFWDLSEKNVVLSNYNLKSKIVLFIRSRIS